MAADIFHNCFDNEGKYVVHVVNQRSWEDECYTLDDAAMCNNNPNWFGGSGRQLGCEAHEPNLGSLARLSGAQHAVVAQRN